MYYYHINNSSMNSLKQSFSITKKVLPNYLKSLYSFQNNSLLNFQVKCGFSVFYNTSKMNFAKKVKESGASKKEQDKQKEKEVKAQLNNEYKDVSQEDLVTDYKNKAKDIVNHVREDLSKIPSLRVTPKLFETLNINLKTQKTELSEIAAVTMKGANIVNIAPFDMDQKDSIIKSLQTTKFDLNIQSEGSNIVVVVGAIPKDLKMELNVKIKRIDTHLKEEIKKLRSAANNETKKLEKITGKDSSRKLDKQIIETIEKEIKLADKEIKMKTDEINNA